MKKVEKPIDYANQNFLVITHSFATGPGQELRDFLISKAKMVVFIDHPFSYTGNFQSTATVFRKGKKVEVLKGPIFRSPEVLVYIKDVVLTVYFGLKLKTKYDWGVACDNLNTLAAVILKVLGISNRVIFYVVDYTPQRFENPTLNQVYHLVDWFACRFANVVWNSAEVMKLERKKKGIKPELVAPQIVVPDGSNFDRIKRQPLSKIDRYRLVFMGHLRENKGIEMILEIFPEVLTKIPKANLLIIGTGPIEAKLKQMAKKLEIEKKVRFAGYVEDHAEVERLMTFGTVGLAPYVPDRSSYTFYSDVGKPKAYLACGLPVIITKVPKFAYDIEKAGAGIAIEYDKGQLKEAILTLLLDRKLYEEYRQRAVEFGSNFTWEKTFNEAFRESLDKINERTRMDGGKRIARDYWEKKGKEALLTLEMNPARQTEWQAIKKAFRISPEREKEIIELGCGTGHFTFRFLKEGFRVTGVDISTLSLKKLKKFADKLGLAKDLTILKSDFLKSEFKERFAAGYLISTYHCLSLDKNEQLSILKNFIKSIKKGGKMLVMEPNPANPLYYLFYLFVYKRNWREGYNIINSRKSLLIDNLKNCGLEQIRLYRFGFLPSSLINFWSGFGKINYFCCRMPIIKNFCAFHILVAQKK